jgi:hypothetical protein
LIISTKASARHVFVESDSPLGRFVTRRFLAKIVHFIDRRQGMKKTPVPALAVVLVILLFCSPSSTFNHQQNISQYRDVFADTTEEYPSFVLGPVEHAADGGSILKEKDNATRDDYVVPSETLNDIDVGKPSCDDGPQDNEAERLLNNGTAPADMHLPDGRIFLRGEPPYGYLPTVNPKENITIPLIPVELD